MGGISNNDVSVKVKKQACEMESIKLELTSRMDKLEALVQQLVGTIKGLHSDFQGLKKGKEHVHDGESSQQKFFFDHQEELSGHETTLLKQHGENGRRSLMQLHSAHQVADRFTKLDVPNFYRNEDPDICFGLDV